MKQFFRGWKRKVGILTLVLACMCMAGWVRSPTGRDRLRFSIDALNYFDIASFGGGLLWERDYLVRPMELNAVERTYAPALFNEFARTFVDLQMNLSTGMTLNDECRFERRWRCCGFDTGEINYAGDLGNFRGTFWFIPYWSIVTPLTILSAYLLISMPRPSTQMKITERVPAERT